MKPPPTEPCANVDEGCRNPARGGRHKYCHSCLSRQRRAGKTQPVPTRGARYASPWQRVLAACDAVADADPDDRPVRERAEKRLRGAINAYVGVALGPHEASAGNTARATRDTPQRGEEGTSEGTGTP